MARLPKEIADFMEAHGVTADEIWLVPGGKNYAVKHSALERIAAEKGIVFDRPSVIEANAADKIAVICVFGTLDGRTEWSFGEAAPYNYRTNEKTAAYPYAFAEKRAKDRVILKLLAGRPGDVMSESEADDFKQPRENPHVTRPEDISDGKPNGEIPHVEDVTARPKAKSRDTYAELEAEMFRMETLPGLMAWGKTIAATVATMHPDFQDTFRRRFAEYRDELKAMAEAAE
jgi:hypothetical protein